MSQDTRYNGWTNYETWAVALWNDNDQLSYRAAREMARDAYRQAEGDDVFSRKERARIDLAETLKEDFEEGNPLADDATLYSDLLSAALSEVNWDEIATHYIDEIADEIDAQEKADEDDDEEGGAE